MSKRRHVLPYTRISVAGTGVDLSLVTEICRDDMKPLRMLAIICAGLLVFSGCSSPPSPPIPSAFRKFPPSPPPFAAATGKSWHLAYDEDFAGDALDLTKVTPCADWWYGGVGQCATGSINNGREEMVQKSASEGQVTVHDGRATITAEPQSPPAGNCPYYGGENACNYKSGMLSTARPSAYNNAYPYVYKFTYGYAEARIKLPTTGGFFSAFWMLDAANGAPYQWETDIFEILGGHPQTSYMQTSWPPNRAGSYRPNSNGDLTADNAACPVIDYSTDWHTWGIDWQPDHIAWRIDGQECARLNGSAGTNIPNVPMFLLINLMVDTGWQRDAKLTCGNTCTAIDTLKVDYLRVWQQS
jgi:beta-glucanase (GH16 family)